jgi:hypothetical protein
LIKRTGAGSDSDVMVVRGVLHGAMALYLTRYLNVPPARIPGEGGDRLDDLPTDSEAIRAALLDTFDRQRQVDQAARLVAPIPRARSDFSGKESCDGRASCLFLRTKGIGPQFPNGVVSSVSFVSTTNTARSLAGSVSLALALTLWRSPGSSEKLSPGRCHAN